MQESRPDIHRSIRLDKDGIDNLLAVMDEEVTSEIDINKRAHERHTYRNQNCVVNFSQPGAQMAISYYCSTRNLSKTGISFLHGGFVHNGTELRVQLISTFGTWQVVAGTVVGCRLVRAPIHEVRVCFEQEIEPSVYCPDAIKRSVLLVDDDPSIVRLGKIFLERLACAVETAENGQIGVEKALQGIYEVVIMDIDMPVMDGWAAVKALRSKGYSGTIVAATAMTRPEDCERCLREGFDHFIAKPYTKDAFSKIFDVVRKEPLVSTLIHDRGMIDVIIAFVEALPSTIRALEEAAQNEILDDLEATVRSLKGEAGGYGFEPISEAAEKLERGIQEGLELAQVKPFIEEVVELCLLARAPQIS
jgi:CheY-like chemotaxis protein